MKTQKWSVDRVRRTFLEYFKKRGHTEVKSSPLLPAEDRTLLFANAGMNQFKNIFTGDEKRSYTKACSAQKCVRAGGKHNDLENVGFTARHHTFFEMLGNFSFGDYFKKEAVFYAWELLTEVFELDTEKLYVTVYKDDDEAYELWKNETDFPSEKIFRLGDRDNFWAMGETGPCGPCSEIHYDLGESSVQNNESSFVKNSRGQMEPDWDCGRFVEIWNLVFMQFSRDSGGNLTPLPSPSVDTGMGLERMTSVLNGLNSNYRIGIFRKIKDFISELSEVKENSENKASFNVIADHARATSFLIADSITPSNEGRGYVLRRIMRRAIRHGHEIGFRKQFFVHVCDKVIELMGEAYPELCKQKNLIKNITVDEEQRFGKTLEKGLSLLSDEIRELRKKKSDTLSGEVVFTLYDTYGFPPDLTLTILEEENLCYDRKEFENAMEKQRERGRQSWMDSEGSEKKALEYLKKQNVENVDFRGYEAGEIYGKVEALFTDDFTPVEEGLHAGESGFAVISPTVFYAESGGQTADTGTLWKNNNCAAEVRDCRKAGEYHLLSVKVSRTILKGEKLLQIVHDERRAGIKRNHSATHLLHLSLKETVGEHATQSGSLVENNRLRFDFKHFNALTKDEIREIEKRVNRRIMSDSPVNTVVKDAETAKKEGAVALFGEKYGEKVRVVKMGDSTELCGGTHVLRTGEIGAFKIVKEEGIAAGVRRIEAVTGEGVLSLFWKYESTLESMADSLKTGVEDAPAALEKLRETEKQHRKELLSLREKLSSRETDSMEPDFRKDGISIYVVATEKGRKEIMTMSDSMRSKIKDGVFIILGRQKGKSALVVSMSGKAEKLFNAGNIIKNILAEFGGRGGGRPDMAQGGADNISEDILRKKVHEIFEK
ncbi:MAG: alanine--tRNA ligase [bacterium]